MPNSDRKTRTHTEKRREKEADTDEDHPSRSKWNESISSSLAAEHSSAPASDVQRQSHVAESRPTTENAIFAGARQTARKGRPETNTVSADQTETRCVTRFSTEFPVRTNSFPCFDGRRVRDLNS